MRKTLFFVFICSEIFGQQYAISVFGFHAADVNLIRDSISIEFQAQNRGLFDLIWPTNNKYKTSFNQKNLSLQKWEKTIKQGSYKTSLSGIVRSGGYVTYKIEHKIKISEDTHTIFTLLELVSTYEKEQIDTRWFDYEHEGSLGRARFIWADSSKKWNGVDSLLCDHYRFDIDIIDSTRHIKTNDYFMNNIIRTGAIRELWVSRSKPKNIILAKVNLAPIPVLARIQIGK